MRYSSLLSVMNERFPFNRPEENYALIVCGNVLVNNVKMRNSSEKIDPASEIIISEKKYVSRGGLKLEHALGYWGINAAGKVFLDAGSSTGGFTDCLLQHGARYVHSVDVGYNQIDYSLRNDKRVILHEKTNIMEVESLSPVPDIGVADLSFRSIVKAAARIIDLVAEKKLIALVKPQFEARKEHLVRGIVSSDKALEEILIKVAENLSGEGIAVQDAVSSPISGRKGNREFFFFLTGESGKKHISRSDLLIRLFRD